MDMRPIDIRRVNVSGEIGRRIDVTIRNNVFAMNVEADFLQPLRDRNREEGYLGLGKLMDAVVYMAAYTNDDEVRAYKNRLVEQVIQTQEPDGYIGTLQPGKRIEGLWDVHEMSYLIYGLISDYRFFGGKASLIAARKLADYLCGCWLADPKKIPDCNVLPTLGIENALLWLYEQTSERRYLDFCIERCRLGEWDAPIVLGRWGKLEGHVYNYLCRCLAQLQLHRLEPDPQLLQPTQRAFEFITQQDGMTIAGLLGEHECWHDTQEGLTHLGETCATAYLIRLLHALLQRDGLPFYGDIMERAILNGLWAAQSPDGRKIRYYTSSDGPRSYFEQDTYCCPNNYRRIVTTLPEMMYYQPAEGLAINLYAPSNADITLRDDVSLRVEQVTEYPRSGRVEIHVTPSKPAQFPLFLRIPRWCEGASVEVNGQPVGGPIEAGEFLKIDRRWKAGNRVQLELPMSYRLVQGRKAQAGRVAVMRGPQLFCLNPAGNETLAGIDLRLLVIDPESLEGPLDNETVRPGGQACRLRAWSPGKWYPDEATDLCFTLTEFADPGGEAIYFKVPNPNAPAFMAEELL